MPSLGTITAPNVNPTQLAKSTLRDVDGHFRKLTPLLTVQRTVNMVHDSRQVRRQKEG